MNFYSFEFSNTILQHSISGAYESTSQGGWLKNQEHCAAGETVKVAGHGA